MAIVAVSTSSGKGIFFVLRWIANSLNQKAFWGNRKVWSAWIKGGIVSILPSKETIKRKGRRPFLSNFYNRKFFVYWSPPKDHVSAYLLLIIRLAVSCANFRIFYLVVYVHVTTKCRLLTEKWLKGIDLWLDYSCPRRPTRRYALATLTNAKGKSFIFLFFYIYPQTLSALKHLLFYGKTMELYKLLTCIFIFERCKSSFTPVFPTLSCCFSLFLGMQNVVMGLPFVFLRDCGLYGGLVNRLWP